MSWFPENISVVKNRWPTVSSLVSEAEAPKSVFHETKGPQATLVIDGIHLSSVYDRLREAELQAALVPRDTTEAWIYGVGLGDVPRVLLARNRIQRLHVCILNPAVFKQSLIFTDHTDWLKDPRVNLLSPDSENDTLHFPFAAVSPCLQLADNRSARLRDLIALELSTPFIHKSHSIANRDLVERLEENTTFARNDGDAASLFDTGGDSAIIIAAAGPTLSDHFAWLQKNQQQFTLIAVDAALKPLADTGIHPDIVLSIDMSLEGVMPFFQGFSLGAFTSTPLVYFPAVHAEILNLWPGPRLTAYPENDVYRKVSEMHPKATLYSSGSVLHPAVDLAVRMGADRIILLGADFSFPDGRSHVFGSPATKKIETAAYWVENGEGRQVATTPNFRGYLRDLEHYIAHHKDILFINGSKKGARIKGTRYMEALP
jgi:hypothetical protein